MPLPSSAALEQIHRRENRAVLATLIRQLGDPDLAEEALQDAWTSAFQAWASGEFPRRPGAWLLTAARRRAFDLIRARRRSRNSLEEMARVRGERAAPAGPLADDQLRLILTCCHPDLPP